MSEVGAHLVASDRSSPRRSCLHSQATILKSRKRLGAAHAAEDADGDVDACHSRSRSPIVIAAQMLAQRQDVLGE